MIERCLKPPAGPVRQSRRSGDGHLEGVRTAAIGLPAIWTARACGRCTPQCLPWRSPHGRWSAVRQSECQITDDTAACEWIGQAVELVDCPEPNPKVTTPSDLPWIEWVLRGMT
ncbi:MAG: 2-C-methyl-D-erythritol 4-phosphate cytidylyltransferase [Verrucomicrobiae bacterium]|nr:2-C-methyl-D-erythritol 4-phosphate cytidylyltransferase [Verrucomicrobiae bacterium]